MIYIFSFIAIVFGIYTIYKSATFKPEHEGQKSLPVITYPVGALSVIVGLALLVLA